MGWAEPLPRTRRLPHEHYPKCIPLARLVKRTGPGCESTNRGNVSKVWGQACRELDALREDADVNALVASWWRAETVAGL